MTIKKNKIVIFTDLDGSILHIDGALGQTRTGTPKRARILSPLCLPISPRGHVVIFIVIVSILIHKSFKEVKKNYFPLIYKRRKRNLYIFLI